jgi:hypothetical protein
LEKKRVEHILPRSGVVREGRREVAQTMYTHVRKCENDKITDFTYVALSLHLMTACMQMNLCPCFSYLRILFLSKYL